MREHKNFWDTNAGLYDCFMRKDRADVYKRQGELLFEAAFFRAGYVFFAIREQIIRCGNRIKRTAHCASARKITARDQTGAEG